MANSALNFSSKRTILTQECLRRLRNTKIELGPEVQNEYLNEFMLKLKNSGYDQKFRAEILDSAMKAFNKMIDDDKNNKKPLYRSRTWNFEERKILKLNKKQNWWNSDKSEVCYKSVLFVPPTPGGALSKELRKREEELNKNNKERIKIVEKGGIKLKDMLIKKDPFKKSKCLEKSCPMCSNSEVLEPSPEEVKISCNTNNIGYRWLCITCQERNITKVYEGETARSARVRGTEHIKALKSKNKGSVLYKHQLKEHVNEDPKFKMEISNKFKDALSRQANEAVRINSRSNSELLNSKCEFNHPPVARIIVERKSELKKQNLKPTLNQ